MSTSNENCDKKIQRLNESLEALQRNCDQEFLVLMGMFVFLMQCGFAFLEAGSVRKKNTVNILIKNILDIFIGTITFWAFGYPFAYGKPGNGLIGHNYFFASNVDLSFGKSSAQSVKNSNTTLKTTADSYFASWFFQYTFAATATTIVSGAMAERVDFVCYIIYSFMITGFIYPVVAHWVWSDNGWLKTGAGTGLSMKDFAGSATVHLCGGIAALVGAKTLGPRLNRFKDNGEPNDIPGHSVPLTSLGAFLLLVGFLACNGGSLHHISKKGDGEEVALAVMNTILCGAFGGLMAMASNRIYCSYKGEGKFWSLLATINGALTGMVSACAGCNDVPPWSTIIIGSTAGVVFTFGRQLVLKAKIDDPLDATAVHIGGGLVGIILTPVFAIRGQHINGKPTGGIIFNGGTTAIKGLGWNILGGVSIILWTGTCCLIIFRTLSLIGMIRISKEVETKGIDLVKHGEHAYAEDGQRYHSNLLLPKESKATLFESETAQTSTETSIQRQKQLPS